MHSYSRVLAWPTGQMVHSARQSTTFPGSELQEAQQPHPRNNCKGSKPTAHFSFIGGKFGTECPAHALFFGHDKMPFDPPHKDRNQHQ